MTLAFHNARIVTPGGIHSGGLSVDGDTIAAIDAGSGGIDCDGDWLLPGFLDTQVNGGGGVLFNDAPTVDTIAAIGAAHARYGTAGFLPTLISDDLDVVDRGMRAVEAAIAAGVPGVLGIHVEGPFLNVARKGIHDASKFRALDADAVALLSGLRHGATLVTLAPECNDPKHVAALADAGVVVAIGHSDADYATAMAALAGGVTGFTHLYNAMSPLVHRAPGVVGAALDHRDSFCGIIVDGAHVDPAALRIALRAKPVDRFMLVSDAMPTVGSDDKRFRLGDRDIVVRDGVCVGPDGTLAGSDLDMATAFRNAVAWLDVDMVQAATMAATAPAAFLRLPRHGALATGMRADIVQLDRDLRVQGVWIGGVRVA
ncbi:N-acetylglucosamine-6-phosphate deacetylase [Sphingomonas sp. CFBP 13720]|uniref:N-acetylglucosamine-6-phosphate deacetylase n=1 Tax=Sphingomonas sp. CFBP 13720 TaxID=2775302 RepID=UPI001785FF35|nr:N-acetylglucosamine-6-phosphate deacetylase [Sphingomonas sp. CFBP 13720]MBD8678457.1 N-acetylglucosamine-6-phosphate deacetylase [Sphingomonas sp. CFBP 13720]